MAPGTCVLFNGASMLLESAEVMVESELMGQKGALE